MNKKVSKEKVDICVDYIQSTYKFEDVLKKYNLLDDPRIQRGYNSIIICCPFHGNDNTPSLSIDTEKNLYNCFGCNEAKGNLVNFISQYETKILHNRMTYYQVIEKALIEDPILQLRVGSKSIFIENKIELSELLKVRVKKSLAFHKQEVKPKTFLELAKFIKAKYKNDKATVLMSAKLMEEGMSPEEIYDRLSTEETISSVDLSKVDIRNFEK